MKYTADFEKIQEIINRKRKEQHVTLMDLASAIGMSAHTYVIQWLQGKFPLVRETLVRIVIPLHCTEEELNELFYAARFLPPTQEELDYYASQSAVA